MVNLLSESIGNRLSTQVLQQRGAQRQVRVESGKLVNTYVGGTGTEHFPSPNAVFSSMAARAPAEVSPEKFYIVRAHFEKRGASRQNAETMALLLLDTAKSLGVPPLSLVSGGLQTDLSLSIQAYATLNQLRVPSDQQGMVKSVNNRNSFKGLAIRA